MECKTFTMKSVAAALLLFVVPLTVDAGAAGFKPAGGYPCRAITDGSRRTKADALQWTLGYLTGRLDAVPSTPHPKFYGADMILRDIVAYCRRNPSGQISDAAEEFLR